jgi:hypothetical protein
VVNAYAPIYDSILVVCAVALAASVRLAPPAWLLALYLVPWLSQSCAEFLHLQVMTVLLGGFGIWILKKAGKSGMGHSKPRQEESTITWPQELRLTGRFQVRSRGLP